MLRCISLTHRPQGGLSDVPVRVCSSPAESDSTLHPVTGPSGAYPGSSATLAAFLVYKPCEREQPHPLHVSKTPTKSLPQASAPWARVVVDSGSTPRFSSCLCLEEIHSCQWPSQKVLTAGFWERLEN